MHSDPTSTGADAADESPTVQVSTDASVSLSGLFASPPPVIGRYRVDARIGHGGMGEVLRAVDPELDRQVAIKLVRGGGRGDEEQRSLLAEARALASLSHPNVVQVYDAGTHDGQVYLAMELVPGVTLHKWLLAEPPPRWQAIVDAFVAAGRGLAAAHAAGIVHGDFKPGNVMVGDDGRVRVFDFGLARRIAPGLVPTGEPAGASPSTSSSELVRGTPTFMAPEQMLGRELTPATDQFSFCVALHVGLWRTAPFDGETMAALRKNVTTGAFRTTSSGGVPLGVRRAIVRGLSASPADRHPSMQALLAALERARGRRRRFIVGFAATGAIAAAVAVGVTVAGERSANTCGHGAARSAEVWSDERRVKIAAKFAEQGKAYADEAAQRVTTTLDAYVEGWNAEHRRACEAARDDDRNLDVEMACLGDELIDLDATVKVLETADEAVVKRAATIVAALPAPGRCLSNAAAGAAERDERVASIRERTAAANAVSRAGRYPDAIAMLVELVADPHIAEYPKLHAHATFLLAEAYEFNGERARALPLFREAIAQTAAARDPEREARGWIHLARVASGDALFDEADTALKQGELLIERLRNDGSLSPEVLDDLEADLSLNAGVIEIVRGNYDAACARLEAGLAKTVDSMASQERRAGLLNNLGVAYGLRGEHKRAREYFGRAAESKISLHGAQHPDVATCRLNEAVSVHNDGDPERSLALFREVIAIRESALGPEHPELATAYNGIATSLNALGRLDESLAMYRKALAIREKALGFDHQSTALARNNIADVLLKQGHIDEAQRYVEEALAQLQRRLGDEHPFTAYALHTLGEVRLARGEFEAAIVPFEGLVRTRETNPGDGRDLALSRFALARALVGAGRDVPRARELATKARAALVEAKRDPKVVAEIDAWLVAQP